jgi:hypothetical protein
VDTFRFPGRTVNLGIEAGCQAPCDIFSVSDPDGSVELVNGAAAVVTYRYFVLLARDVLIG